ncbi:MAG: AmmeMemoRadiSam system protein A [Candidatus Caldatribacterium sp.]|uniref:AmmeMemoRadiSam system protein A n=1 Tax=Candidatus Caldatribacterium sp. TaxID=2282143 RepID=UPI002994DCE5|nr:AmmeMemoRadiSam system protein A [Candidatus Caldatribacterium sp.]MCX7730041.1 AmmeMemoRadiSam system protein A [Candidatus Caldatribacterium sp.]MDW8080687.1 AmmeMemoRadiSam system protein A [Candidatus Calescibacterium sp.]
MGEEGRFQKDVIRLAREAIAYYLKEGKLLPIPSDLHPRLYEERRGVFVSLKRGKALRGCIGTYLPQWENIAQEIVHNAVHAATQDPRFPPVTLDELSSLTISVDILSPPERVEDLAHLDPKKYGVIVESGWKRGLLLPDIEGVDTVEEQIRIALMKAGITSREPITVYRFTVERYRE